MNDKIEKLSSAVSLTVLELEFLPNELIPAYLLANLMSPALWAWRSEKNVYNDQGALLSTKNRLNQIQRFFHRYTFTSIPNEPGGDPWGLLNYAEEERRFGSEFVLKTQAEYDTAFRKLLAENPESQFGQIMDQSYYLKGFFPRLKNETVEVMNAFERVSDEGKKSGKCIGLAMLWAVALVVWGRFPLDHIIITGNRTHMFVFLDIEDGHLFNNTKWFSSTRIRNRSKLSELTRKVTSSTETLFFYNPEKGLCHFATHISQIPQQQITSIFARISDFVSIPLKQPDLEKIQFIQPSYQIPNPLEYDTPENYQNAIVALAKQYPDSIYEYTLYAFRWLDVLYPQVYIRAALRDYKVKKLAQEIKELQDALSIITGITGQESIFGGRDRIMMPDEIIYFKTGNDRDKALLLYTLLQHSPISDTESVIGLSIEDSYFSHQGKWIDLKNLSLLFSEPADLKVLFNAGFSKKK